MGSAITRETGEVFFDEYDESKIDKIVSISCIIKLLSLR